MGKKNQLPKVYKRLERPEEDLDLDQEINPLAAPVVEDPISDIPDNLDPAPAAQPHPSEFDPDSDPSYKFMDDPDYGPASDFVEQPEAEAQGTIHDSGYVAPETTGVNHLGNPAEPEFNPRDPSMGFYQGIDPVTGERIYSVRK